MSKKSTESSFDFAYWQSDVVAQFRNLDPNDPSRWPSMPRYLLLLATVVVTVGALWYAILSNMVGKIEGARQQEVELRDQYSSKLAKAVNLEALQSQLVQVRLFVTQLERQLPSKAEMDALLSDINQAGLGRSLQFELFRPAQEVVRDFYVERPIAVRVTGRYHDIGLFVSDISHLSRIVTIHNVSLEPVQNRPDILAMDAIIRTFRYLDPHELNQRQQEQQRTGGRP